MKNIQISQELFVAITKYFLLGQEELSPEIEKGLALKLDALVKRELYTKYKTAPTEEEREKARQDKSILIRLECIGTFAGKFFLEVVTGAWHALVNNN